MYKLKSNLLSMGYGFAHILQGLALILSFGFWNPTIAYNYAIACARYYEKKTRSKI